MGGCAGAESKPKGNRAGLGNANDNAEAKEVPVEKRV